jgi:hypothetical protein
MAQRQLAYEVNLGRERELMISDVVLVVFCALVALCGLAVVVWEGATGRLFSIDGLALTLISLMLAVVFGGNVAWSVWTGELQQILGEVRKGRKKAQTSDNNSPAGVS